MLSDGDTLKMNDPSVIKDFEGYGQKSFYGRKYHFQLNFIVSTLFKLFDPCLMRTCPVTRSLNNINCFLRSDFCEIKKN